jgi:hypothetical protein
VTAGFVILAAVRCHTGMHFPSKLCGAAALCALALPAAAIAKDHPSQPGKDQPTPKPCKIHNVAFIASGTLAAPATLTQARGADTPDNTADDRYSGTLTVTITRPNHHAKAFTSPVTVTVANIRLGKGVTATPAAGTRVKLVGKITKVHRGCDATGAGVITARKATLRAPKPPKAPKPA